MPIVRPLSPDGLRRALEQGGYRVIDEDPYNWVLARSADDEPIIVPKMGDQVSVEIMESVMERARTSPDGQVLFDAILETLRAE